MAEEENDPKAEGEEGETKEGGEGLAPAEGKFDKKKKLIVIGAVAGLLLLGGGGAGLYFSGVIGGGQAEGEAHGESAASTSGEHGGESKDPQKEEAKGAPVFLSLGDILVNLSGDGKRPNFLKIKIDLELADEKDKAALTALKPRIIDNFQVYLRELRVEDLRGSAGLYRLREELLLRVTEAVQPIRVRDVLFQEMLVQ